MEIKVSGKRLLIFFENLRNKISTYIAASENWYISDALADTMSFKWKQNSYEGVRQYCSHLMYAQTSCLMDKLWNDWMTDGDKPLIAAGNLYRLLIPMVTGWMKNMWESIPEEMVHKSSLKSGISNNSIATCEISDYDWASCFCGWWQ